MSPVKVAITGATGNLGIPVVQALLDAKYPVTVLTRKGSSNTSKLPKDSNLTIAEVDYTSVSSLTEALQGHTVVVSAVASESVGSQNPLIDASVAAGVTRFIPSEFGSNTVNPKSAALPVFKYKVDTQAYLKDVVAKNPGFSYTLVMNGAFFDWGLANGFIINPAKHSATVFNGGDVPFSTTTLATIGAAVVGIIKNLPETANRPVYIQDALVTQNQLIAYGKEADDKVWDITNKDTEVVKGESFAELQKGPAGNIGSAMVGFIMSAIFGQGYGGNFSAHLDNELLGIKGMSEAEIKALVRKSAS